jgi:acyl-CoA thioesterase FadM
MEGIIHFSRFLIYMETAEHLFLNELGGSVAMRHDGERLGWPRLAVGCEFLRPVRFEDELDIRIFVLRKGRRALTYGCEFFHDGHLVARGQSSSACCILGGEDGLRATDIPAALAANIEQAPEEERAAWQAPIRGI